MQEDEIEQRVRADIARCGWHVVILPPEGGTPGWMHTIGLQERFDHPELIVFGTDIERLGPLVNELGERVRAGERYAEAAEVEGILIGHPLAFRPVAWKWTPAFLGNAAWHYRSETVPTIQCFWPDPDGRFPWDPDADPTWREDQPLLFEEQTHLALSERMIDVLRREGAL